MRDKLPCGCTHDGSQWKRLCREHATEFEKRHAEADRDYRACHCAAAGAAVPNAKAGVVSPTYEVIPAPADEAWLELPVT